MLPEVVEVQIDRPTPDTPPLTPLSLVLPLSFGSVFFFQIQAGL